LGLGPGCSPVGCCPSLFFCSGFHFSFFEISVLLFEIATLIWVV
jgi:hypothetical protein